MNGRRKLLLLALAISPVLVIGAACSFPEVSFAPVGGTPESGTVDSPSGADGQAGDSAPVGANEDVDPTGSMKDASTVPEGGGHIEAGPDGCCDCDNDNVMADGGTCGKPSRDCDDLNKYIFPGQGPVASSTWNTTWTPTYDWDCDGVVLKQYNHGVGKCTSHSQVLDSCAAHQGGFEGDPACGTSGHYVITCANDPNALSTGCVETSGIDRVQGCQ
jgi:hypothetical protein